MQYTFNLICVKSIAALLDNRQLHMLHLKQVFVQYDKSLDFFILLVSASCTFEEEGYNSTFLSPFCIYSSQVTNHVDKPEGVCVQPAAPPSRSSRVRDLLTNKSAVRTQLNMKYHQVLGSGLMADAPKQLQMNDDAHASLQTRCQQMCHSNKRRHLCFNYKLPLGGAAILEPPA